MHNNFIMLVLKTVVSCLCIRSKDRVAPIMSSAVGRASPLSISNVRESITGRDTPAKEKNIPAAADIMTGLIKILDTIRTDVFSEDRFVE